MNVKEIKSKFANTYHLKIVYPASHGYHQSYTKEVEADRVEVDKGGSYVFYNKSYTMIAAYSIQYTIIEKITINE